MFAVGNCLVRAVLSIERNVSRFYWSDVSQWYIEIERRVVQNTLTLLRVDSYYV
jgi:valyl-tRNA synthetase